MFEHERVRRGRPNTRDRQLVPVLNAFDQRLARHIRTHRDVRLEVHEQRVLDAWRAEAGRMLGGVVTAQCRSRSGPDWARCSSRGCCAHTLPNGHVDKGTGMVTRLASIVQGWRLLYSQANTCCGWDTRSIPGDKIANAT